MAGRSRTLTTASVNCFVCCPARLLLARALSRNGGCLQADVGRLRDQESDLRLKLAERVATGERLVAERTKELTALKREGERGHNIQVTFRAASRIQLPPLPPAQDAFSERQLALRIPRTFRVPFNRSLTYHAALPWSLASPAGPLVWVR